MIIITKKIVIMMENYKKNKNGDRDANNTNWGDYKWKLTTTTNVTKEMEIAKLVRKIQT